MTTSKDGPSSPKDKVPAVRRGFLDRFLGGIERIGNRLPDPAVLFVIGLLLVWAVSWLLAGRQFAEIDPRTGQPIVVNNQLTGSALASFMATMVTTFVNFHPLGVVLVALLGVGVAEHTGFINAGLKGMLSITSKRLLTPMLILVACVSHTAVDAGYVLVIPLGGVIFYAAGRHPLAGIAAAFAGVSGGFSANFVPSSLDPLLQGLTQQAAQILDPERTVNPLCNWGFTSASTLLVMLLGWFVTDRIVEPRLAGTPVELDEGEDLPRMEGLTPVERRGLWAGLMAMLLGVALLTALVVLPAESVLRAPDPDGKLTFIGSITSAQAPLMQSIVPLIFLFFLLPGVVYGYVANTIHSHRDIIKGMSKSMGTMAYYIVMAFFAALFIAEFGRSNLGALFALKGASFLRELGVPGWVTILGIIALTAAVNLLVGSASAKWALLAPIFVPMLMSLGISPELTQAAYRVGDSTTNIITPLMPYFPLVVVFCQRYSKKAGIGTVVSMMLPFTLVFIGIWTLLLLGFWGAGIPLGLDAPYSYPSPALASP